MRQFDSDDEEGEDKGSVVMERGQDEDKSLSIAETDDLTQEKDVFGDSDEEEFPDSQLTDKRLKTEVVSASHPILPTCLRIVEQT